MLHLPQTVGYAIRVLMCMGRDCSDRHLARDIAGCTQIPLPYLRKVLRGLADAGLVQAKRGYQGGFELVGNAEDIRLMEVVRAFGVEIEAPRCILGFSACSEEDACPLHEEWSDIRLRLSKRLSELRISDVSDFADRRGAVQFGSELTAPAVARDEAKRISSSSRSNERKVDSGRNP